MGSSVISLGLGLGGGKAATSSGRLPDAGGEEELAYPGGLWTKSNYEVSVQPIFHFDGSILDGSSAANNPSDGTAVSTWGNRSGQVTDYDATQGTGANQPLFQGTYLDFDGSNDYLTIANAPGISAGAAFTTITVAYKDGSSIFAPIGKTAIQNAYYVSPLNYSSGTTYFLDNSNASVSSAGYGPHFDSIQQFVFTKDTSNNWTYYLQGNNSYKTGSYTGTHTGNFGTLGNNGYYHDGRIYELILFDSALSVADLNVIRTYLNNKYAGLPSSTEFS